eukprot:scaffold1534_cov267-Pinguiococcus_pyrenoidosus.AAC.4
MRHGDHGAELHLARRSGVGEDLVANAHLAKRHRHATGQRHRGVRSEAVVVAAAAAQAGAQVDAHLLHMVRDAIGVVVEGVAVVGLHVTTGAQAARGRRAAASAVGLVEGSDPARGAIAELDSLAHDAVAAVQAREGVVHRGRRAGGVLVEHIPDAASLGRLGKVVGHQARLDAAVASAAHRHGVAAADDVAAAAVTVRAEAGLVRGHRVHDGRHRVVRGRRRRNASVQQHALDELVHAGQERLQDGQSHAAGLNLQVRVALQSARRTEVHQTICVVQNLDPDVFVRQARDGVAHLGRRGQGVAQQVDAMAWPDPEEQQQRAEEGGEHAERASGALLWRFGAKDRHETRLISSRARRLSYGWIRRNSSGSEHNLVVANREDPPQKYPSKS